MLFLSSNFQKVLGFGPLVSGLAHLPVTSTVFSVTHFMPGLIERFGASRLQLSGCILVACTFAAFSFFDIGGGYAGSVLGPMLLHSFGIALVFTPGTVLTMEGVAAEQSGTASGLLQMDQQIGGALGFAVITSVFAFASITGGFASGLPMAFGVAALFSAIAAALTYVVMPTARALIRPI